MDWPLLSAVKAGRKKKVGRKKGRERKSQPHGLRSTAELHLRSDGGGSGAPPSVLICQPFPVMAESWRRTASPLGAGERAATPAGLLHSPTGSGRTAPFITPSLPSEDTLGLNVCGGFLLILKPSVRSERVASLTPPPQTCLMGNETPWRICPPTLSQRLISHD